VTKWLIEDCECTHDVPIIESASETNLFCCTFHLQEGYAGMACIGLNENSVKLIRERPDMTAFLIRQIAHHTMAKIHQACFTAM
jgi:hypothetical protein